jgi:release factor glutamine methyltransferase
MKSVLDILSLSTDYLKKKGVANPKRQAEDLLCDVLGMDRLGLYVGFDRPLNDSEIVECRQRLARRVQGEPLQYIHGHVSFYGCSLFVTPAVLIPRQETEILVDHVAKFLGKMSLKGKSLWDVCCGSGCIGIALKKRFPELDVTLSDISKEALALAKMNAERNGVTVRFLEGDLLTPFIGEKTDFLISNPPYISESEYATLDREVRDFEPKKALVAGSGGAEFYERFAREMPIHLNPGAYAWFEIGYNQGAFMLGLFEDTSWKDRRLEKDWSGHDRFFFLENE